MIRESQVQFAYKKDPTQPELWNTVYVTQNDGLAGKSEETMQGIADVMRSTGKVAGSATLDVRMIQRVIGDGDNPPVPLDVPPRKHTIVWDESANTDGHRIVTKHETFSIFEAKASADTMVNFESYYVKLFPAQPMPPSPHHGWTAKVLAVGDFA